MTTNYSRIEHEFNDNYIMDVVLLKIRKNVVRGVPCQFIFVTLFFKYDTRGETKGI